LSFVAECLTVLHFHAISNPFPMLTKGDQTHGLCNAVVPQVCTLSCRAVSGQGTARWVECLFVVCLCFITRLGLVMSCDVVRTVIKQWSVLQNLHSKHSSLLPVDEATNSLGEQREATLFFSDVAGLCDRTGSDRRCRSYLVLLHCPDDRRRVLTLFHNRFHHAGGGIRSCRAHHITARLLQRCSGGGVDCNFQKRLNSVLLLHCLC
jgi:hypothetical protein